MSVKEDFCQWFNHPLYRSQHGGSISELLHAFLAGECCAIGFSDACDNSGMLASYNMTSLCLTYDRSISAHVCS